MIGCGTNTFTDPDDYRMNVPGAGINLVVTGPGDFKARLTWIRLNRVALVRAEERAPRIAFVTLAPGQVFVSLPLHHDPPAMWNGVEMRSGEIVLHGSNGEQIHHRTKGPAGWGLISLASTDSADLGRVLARVALSPPAAAKILAPSKVTAELLRLHAQACRIAETRPDTIAHPHAAWVLEQDVLGALVKCLTVEEPHRHSGPRHRHAGIMARLENVLASHPDQQLPMRDLCALVGAPERTLRMCCARFLGMSPGSYARLRRLNLVRAALRRADPETASVEAVARQYGFSELGRFAVAYRTLFGEPPSRTLRADAKSIRGAAPAEFA